MVVCGPGHTPQAWRRASTRIMGATVDVGTLDVDLSDGILAMDRPFRSRILRLLRTTSSRSGKSARRCLTGPLLRAKIAIDSVVVRDIRFNSRRETPGEVDTLRERSTLFRDEMARWRASARIPTLPTPSLSSLVDFSSLSPDSLQTVLRARELAASVNAARGAFTDRVEALDVGAQIDSASALLASLEGASFRNLGPVGAVRTLGALRSMAAGVTDIVTRVAELEENFESRGGGPASGTGGAGRTSGRRLQKSPGCAQPPLLRSRRHQCRATPGSVDGARGDPPVLGPSRRCHSPRRQPVLSLRGARPAPRSGGGCDVSIPGLFPTRLRHEQAGGLGDAWRADRFRDSGPRPELRSRCDG